MMPEGFNTYTGWIAAGRAVQKGQKATARLVSPDGEKISIFHQSQTDVAERWDFTDWTVEDVTESTRKQGPTVKIDFDGEHMYVWVGNNSKAIELIQDLGAAWIGRTHRWKISKHTTGPEKFIARCGRRGWNVEFNRVEPRGPAEPASPDPVDLKPLAARDDGERIHVLTGEDRQATAKLRDSVLRYDEVAKSYSFPSSRRDGLERQLTSRGYRMELC